MFLKCLVLCIFRSLLPSTSLDQESETVEPFSRADVLYNQSVDKIAELFDTDKYEGSTKCDFYSSSCKVVFRRK